MSLRVLIACEYSGRVRDAFIAKGHDAISCDLLPTDTPGPHHEGNVIDLLSRNWDLLIAHPPCTYLSNSGAKHLYNGMKKVNGKNMDRWSKMHSAAIFFKVLLNAQHIPRIAVENPIMVGHAKSVIGQEQSQTIQPWQFGHKEMKATCLWLKGLPLLKPSNIVGPPPTEPEERKKWAIVHRCPPGPDRWKIRSTTYQGIADAMAEQWSEIL